MTTTIAASLAAMCGGVAMGTPATLRLHITGTSVIVRRLDTNRNVTSVEVLLPNAPRAHPAMTRNVKPPDDIIPGHNAFLKFPLDELNKATTRGQLLTSTIEGTEFGFFVLDNGEDLALEKSSIEKSVDFDPRKLPHLVTVEKICGVHCPPLLTPPYSARLTITDGVFSEGESTDDLWKFQPLLGSGSVNPQLLQDVVVTWSLRDPSLVLKSSMPGNTGNLVLTPIHQGVIDLVIGTAPMGLMMNPPPKPINQNVDTHFENVYSLTNFDGDQPPVPWKQNPQKGKGTKAVKLRKFWPQNQRMHGIANCPPVMIDAPQTEMKK